MYLFKKRFYTQIEEYYTWKSQRYPTMAVRDREFLLKFAKASKALDITEIKDDEVRDFINQLNLTGYFTYNAEKAVRNFVRYYRVRGYPVLVGVPSYRL